MLRRLSKRRAVPPQARAKVKHKGFPAPVRGLVTAENLAATGPASAQVLENFTPTQTGIKIRGGSPRYATIDESNVEPVRSLMAYIGGATRKLFAADETNIFDITSPVDENTAPTADVTGQTSGYYSYVNFATTGGNYMPCVNGTDELQLYDGSSWTAINGASTPAITHASVTTDELSHVSSYRNRLFFTRGGTLYVHYLPVDSIGGALGDINMSGTFKKGGAVHFTATWSLDSGAGLDDKFVVVSTEGEIAVFEGSDPSSSSTWNLVGVYEIPPSLGFNAIMKAGGDLVLGTEGGMIPISAAVTKDPAALSLSAISRNIEPTWLTEVVARRGLPWEIVKWPEKNLAYISQPVVSDANDTGCFVVNLQTGAWSQYSGWDTRCFALHDDQVYFGSNDGTIKKAEVGGWDDVSTPYTAKYAGSWDHLGSIGAVKAIKQARSVWRTANVFSPQMSGSINYALSFPSAPNGVSEAEDSLWDAGLWDEALWDVGQDFYTYNSMWVSIGKTGFSFAPQVQVTIGGANTPTAELAVFDVTYEEGGLVV